MKKHLHIILGISILLFTLNGLNSCKRHNIKTAKGIVETVDASTLGDSLKSMKIIVESDTLAFDMSSAAFSNGMMFPKDCVEVKYEVGKKDTLHALLVTVKAKPGHVVNLDSMRHNKLITR